MHLFKEKWTYIAFFTIVIVSKFLWLIISPDPLFYLGDSASYLWTAETGWIPPDRSFVYGILIGKLLKIASSLHSVVVFQTFCSILASFALTYMLIFHVGCSPKIGCALGTVFALEPIQIFYERFIMTEALSGLFWTLFLCFGFSFLKNKSILKAIGIAVAAVILISLRTAYAPVVLVSILALAICALEKNIRSISICVTLLVAFIALLHGYKVLNGILSKKPPALQYEDGFFLVAVASPLIDREVVERSGISLDVYNLWKPFKCTWNSRNAERWLDGGLVNSIKKIYPEDITANKKASELAICAIMMRPFGFLKLGIGNYMEYFKKNSLENEIDEVPSPPNQDPAFGSNIQMNYGFVRRENSGIVTEYYKKSLVWHQILLIAPFVYLLFTFKYASRYSVFYISAYTSAICVAIFLAPIVVPRYLHPLPALFLLALGAILGKLRGHFLFPWLTCVRFKISEPPPSLENISRP